MNRNSIRLLACLAVVVFGLDEPLGETTQDKLMKQLMNAQRHMEQMEAHERAMEVRLATMEANMRTTRRSVQQPIGRRLDETDHIGNNISAIGKAGAPPDNQTQAERVAANVAAFAAAEIVLGDFNTKIGEQALCLDYMWLLISGALVMFMQAGFAILESGSVRSKNGAMVLMKNVIDACFGTISWYLIGYGLAYGVADDPGDFMGVQNFAGADFLQTDAEDSITGTGHFKDWFFQWAFCATAATIVSGGVAERVKLPAYVFYSVVMTGFIYPVIVYWTWSGSGWLTNGGYSDFAGSGIVHLTGGIAALVGSTIVGPRSGRWDTPELFDPHNMGLVVLGTFILWFGWYGFNCGSTLAFSDAATATTGAFVAMNTTISAAAGGLTVWAWRLRHGRYDLAGICNGILAGLVACCAGVGDMMPELALVTGILGGCGYEAGHVLVKALKIDDPLDAFAVHGCGGIVGVITRPLFSRTGVDGEMMKYHILALLAIISWSGGITLIVFLPLRLAGQLRVDAHEERVGGDTVLSPPKMYADLDPADKKKESA